MQHLNNTKYLNDLATHDHVWLMDNFIKTSQKSIYHPWVMGVLENYFSKNQLASIEITKTNKPFIAKSPISFNLSHSSNTLVLALSLHGEIGVDIEKIRTITKKEQIIKKYFAQKPKDIDFFNLWCAHEAFAKCLGENLLSVINKTTLRKARHGVHMGLKELYTHKVNFITIKNDYCCAIAKYQNNIKNLKVINFT